MHGHQHHHFRPCDGARGAAAPPQPPPQLPSQLSQQRPPQPQQFPPFFPPNTNAYGFLQNPAFSNPSFNAYHQNPNFPHQKLTNNYAAPPKPKYSIERIDQTAVKAHRDLLAAGEFVSAWKVSQSALLSLQVDSWSSLGFSMQQIPSLYRLMLIEGKVSAFIHCFVGVRKITSVYELGAEICKNEGVERFEELELGPLLRHPLVVHYFSVPSEVKEVVKITSAELISYLAEFMDCHKRKHIRAEELLDFIASKESVSVRENLGIRIQSLGMHIHSIQEARKSEASTLNNYSCRVRHVSGAQTRKVEGDLSLHPPIILQKKALNRRFEVLSQRLKSFSPINGGSKHIRFVSSSSDDKSDDDSEDSEDGNVINSQSKISLQIEKKCDTRPSSCPYPSATEEMVRLGLKNDMVAQPSPSSGGLKCNESKRSSGKKRKLESQNSDSLLLGKLRKRDKDELDIDILQPENDAVKSERAVGKSASKSLVKDGNLGLCRQTMETFITTWKEACRTHSVAEVFERMLHFYSTSPRQKKRVRSMFSLFPCIGLLHVAVTSIKCGMWDSLYDTLQTIGEDITPIASPAEHERVIVEPSSEKDALSVEEHSSQPECSATVDDIIKKVAQYFELDPAISREGKSVLEKQFMCLKKLHDCEIWLTKQFSVKDFASFGFGDFFRFLEDHPFLLSNNFSEISSGEVNTKFPVEVLMLQNQLGILVSQAASNLWEGGIITKQHISELLKQQFPLVSFQVNVNETLEDLSEFLKDEKVSDTSSCILFSGTLGTPYTWNPVVPNKNFLVDSSGVKTDSGHRVGALGSLSAKDAVECLLKAPMLSDLQSWAHWDCIFAPSLGPLLEWLSTEACIKELLCLVTKDGKIIRIDRSATVEQFLEALLKGSSFQTAVKLLSLFSLYGGKQHAPLSLLKFHARRAMEVILKNSIDSKGVKKSSDLSDRSKDFLRGQILNEEITANLLAVADMESHNPSENQFSISEAVSVASRFILDCLGHLPSEFRSFAADILLSGLRSFTKDAPLAMLRECSQIYHRLMLHDIGLSLNISEWIADYHVFNSTTATDLLVCLDASRSGAASTALSLDTKLIPDEVKPLASEGKMIVSIETDEHVVLCGELQRGEDLDELSIENCSGGCTRVVLKNAEDQDATRIIESIRRDEFGLIPTLTNAESSMLSKQHARLGRALHCLSQELYSQDSHFLLELVQNADDNLYLKNEEPTLVFILQSTGIIVLNNEQGFSAQNIRALCDVGNSTKRGASTGYIGRKGIGFKSVFRVTDAPEIHSNGFHVKFDISEGQIGFVLPTVVTPCDLDSFGRFVPGEASQVDATCWNTCIVLPFKRKLIEENGMSTIMSMFSDLHPSLLLFLHRLRSIKFKNMLNGSSIVMRRETVGDGIVKVSHGDEKMNWFVATQELMASAIRPDVQTTEIAIAFTLKESSNGEYGPHLDQQPVFAFLPLRTYGLKFILQGDFVLPSSREEVDGDSAWNQWLLSEFPGLFVSAQRSFCALSCFQERPGKAVTAYMSFVPLIGEVHGFFSHLPRMIISKLRTSNCMLLEGHNKEWVPPCRVLRGWDEQARVLLSETLLHEHLGLGYLDKDIILSDHLAKALGVHDYGPKILIDIMSSICHTANGVKSLGLDWLSCWLNTLYVMLVPAAWKTSVNALAESDLNKSLKNVPFIPLSDGSYGSVAEGTIWLPCDVFSSRNDPEHCLEAFPNLYAKLRTVSPALLLAAAGTTNSVEEMPVDNLIRMLHRIGVQRLSAHQIVKMHILPAISDDKITNKDKNLMVEYLSFIMVHFQSSCTSCSMEREQIISELQNKAFILTNHGYKRPAEVSIHFCREFGNPVDMNRLMDAADFEWHEVDIIYLKHSSTKSLSSGLMKWREFFQELGVSDFVQIIQVEKNVADVSQSVLRDIMCNGDLIIPGSIAKDWESPELVHILSSLSHQNDQEKSKYLLEVLDKMWDDCFSAKVAGCCISGSPVQDIKSFKSSFVKSIIDFQWISSSMDQMLHYPKDLFFDREEVRSILGNFAPYAIPQVRSRKFLCDIGFKTLVTLDDALQILHVWRRSKTPFEASIAQMSKLYAFIWDGVNTSKEKIVEVFGSGPSVFVPFADVSRHDDVVSGKFLSPSEVYWHDPTGSMDQTKKLLLQCGSVNEINCPLSKTLAHVYQGLHNFFVDECGVHESPPFRSYFQILVQLSSTVLPSQAANAVLRVLLKWAEDLKSGLAEQEDIIYLKECLLKLDITVLPTVQDKWVSLHPTFGLVCWCDDEDLKKEFMDSESLNFLYFGDLSKKEKEMLPAKIAELMQTLGIPSLSQVITREAIFYGIEDCRDKASLVNWVLPYAQRYICKLHPDIYFQLKHSGVGNLSSLQVVVVEKLFYRHTIKGCDSASKKRSESSCLLQENILYITRASDAHSIFLELSRLFFKGTPDLHLANFLHMITTMGESGSTKEQMEFFIVNNQKVPQLPDDEPAWLLSSLLPQQLEDRMPQTTSVSTSIDEQNLLKSKKKPGSSPNWPPVDWKTAPDFSFARENRTRTRPGSSPPNGSLKEEDRVEGFIPNREDQNVSAGIGVDWIIQEDLVNNSDAVALPDFKATEDPNLLVESGSPVFGMVGGSLEELKSISRIDERDQLSFGTPNENQAVLTGRMGEFIAFQYFTDKVGTTSVTWVNKEVETGLPYDIVIGEKGECKEYVEVKATKSLKKDWFTISTREWQFAAEKGESFSIAHVTLLGQKNAKVTVFKNPLKLCQQGVLHLAVLMRHHPKELAFVPYQSRT